MRETIAIGAWVEIHGVVLASGERSSKLPEDTRRLPLEMRVKGFLLAPGRAGDEVEILTPAGRRLRGTLTAVNPPYAHGFGAPIPQLSAIGAEVKALLRARGLVQ